MAPVLENNLDEIARLCRQYGIRRLEVFGSAARGSDFDPDRSDIDFLYEMDRRDSPDLADRYFDFIDAAEALLGRPVSMVSIRKVSRPEKRFLCESLNRDRQVLYVQAESPAA